ncbi:MAG: phage/plasmid replication protein, II/X family, partial [Ferruginibacter sp.]
TNILMYIEHSRDRDYIYFENSILKYNIEKAPDFFMHFIKYFFWKEFILYDIDFSDVEINRIDVCFNQVFATREDALYYLDYQKKIRKKHSREEGDVFYESSLMSITKRHSEKIYHKGTEYKKHDLKQHQKINNEKGRKIFDIEKLQEFADRILRYEITLRNPELNYLFKHNIFRKKCAIFKINLENYKRIGNIKKRNERTAKAIAELPPSERALYTKLHPYEAIDKNDSSTFKYVSHLMESSPKFMLAISSESDLFNKYTVVNAASDKALFSKKLIGLCLQKLSDYIHNFQLRELPAEEVISISIDNYNLSHRHKLPKADMIQFYLLLAQTGSFKEANKLSRYSHATLYRYKDRFKKIGISENHIKPDDNFSLPEAPIDLKEYHAFLTRNNHVIKTTHIEYGL